MLREGGFLCRGQRHWGGRPPWEKQVAGGDMAAMHLVKLKSAMDGWLID